MVLGIHLINYRWDFYFMGTKLLLYCFIKLVYIYSHALCLRNYLVE